MAPRKIGDLLPPSAYVSNDPLPVIAWHEALIRVHKAGKEPKFFGRTGENRFDAPAKQFGVLYAASDEYGAFIETFGDNLGRTVTRTSLSERGFARIIFSRELRLVDLTGSGLAKVGADSRLFAGEHGPAQEFSLACWTNPADVDGLIYRCRHDPSKSAVAIYDRAEDVVSTDSLGSLMSPKHAGLVGAILDNYGFALIPA